MEFGAGTGKLAAGLLAALDALGVELDEYLIVDLSGELRERQRETIAAAAPALAGKVRWLDALPERFDGVVVGNEVLDAMPVRLFAKAGDTWFERGVALDARHAFVFEDRPAGAAGVPAVLATLDVGDGYVTETHEAALAFTRTVCTMLARGAVLLVDYGFPAQYYHPQRERGTLMCHYRHHARRSVPVSGAAGHHRARRIHGIYEAGIATGADLLGYTSQARFLLNAGVTDALAAIDPSDIRAFLPAANAVQKLISEAEMGELFKVIGFSRGIDGTLDVARGDRSHALGGAAMLRWLMTSFVAVMILTRCWPWLGKLGVGRLPGDVTLTLGGLPVPVHVDAGADDASVDGRAAAGRPATAAAPRLGSWRALGLGWWRRVSRSSRSKPEDQRSRIKAHISSSISPRIRCSAIASSNASSSLVLVVWTS
jgi:SAM-dependent MidA family methyltransferase